MKKENRNSITCHSTDYGNGNRLVVLKAASDTADTTEATDRADSTEDATDATDAEATDQKMIRQRQMKLLP